MPAVKKKTAAKKARKKTASARKKTGGAPAGVAARLSEMWRASDAGARRFGAAAAALALVGGLVAGAIFWAGGYLGALIEDAERGVERQVAAAGLSVRRVMVRGRRETSIDDLTNAVGPVVGASLPHLDLDAARARIEALGWVRSAAVTRLLPGTLSVTIRERAPAAVWQISYDFHLIDREGAIIRQVDRLEYAGLPHIVGAGAPEAAAELLRALAGHREIESRTASLVRVGERRWNLRLKNDTDVKLPEAGFEDALEALAIMQAAHGTLDREFEYIDLRDPEQVTMRPRKIAPIAE